MNINYTDTIQKQNAFILRIAPSGNDRVSEALQTNEIIIGWSSARGLLDENLSWQEFREIIYTTYHTDEPTYKSAGAAAGNIWRFIRDMKIGDLVVVPHWSEFYIAEVSGIAYHDETKINEDTAYRRPVKWLNNKNPIQRRFARLPLTSRMKAYNTCVNAGDLLEEIYESLNISSKGTEPTFEEDLRLRLIEGVKKEIHSGRIDCNGFERLIASILRSMGAGDVKIRHGASDKGADIICNCNILNKFNFVLAVQAKHYTPEPPVEKNTIDQLVSGMEAESADLGWVVTSGTYSEDAKSYATNLREQGRKIELIDGEDLATMVVESGLKEILNIP